MGTWDFESAFVSQGTDVSNPVEVFAQEPGAPAFGFASYFLENGVDGSSGVYVSLGGSSRVVGGVDVWVGFEVAEAPVVSGFSVEGQFFSISLELE